MDREGVQRAKPRAVGLEREQERVLLNAAARAWVERVGFPLRLRSYAILAALELRSELGEGQVSKGAVMGRMRARQPWLFDNDQTGEQAA